MTQLQGFLRPNEVLASEGHLPSNVELFVSSVPAAFVRFLATSLKLFLPCPPQPNDRPEGLPT